jgi:uncharacterized protein (DUF885 family)
MAVMLTHPTPRQIADDYVEQLADLNPMVATALGIRPGSDAMPDFSPAGAEALAELARTTLTRLDGLTGSTDAIEDKRCARLLHERLTATLGVHAAGEHLRAVSNIGSPMHGLRSIFLMMPTATSDDWAVIARRLANVPACAAGYRETLAAGISQGLLAGPSRVAAAIAQLDEWVAGEGWYASFVAAGPVELQAELTDAATRASAALAELRDWLAGTYAAAADGAPEPSGAERYAINARYWTGSDLDLAEAYAWGWEEYRRLEAEIRAAASAIVPGASPAEAMEHLNQHGEAIEGVEAVRAWLQDLMDRTIAELDGTHIDLAEPVRRVEAMIAPPGSAAAPYYTRPSLDFSRPGRTWLPTQGRTRFPTWSLVSTWYHEGVPGHHLQLAQWAYLADSLSRFQVSVGSVSAMVEGWALYAERLMDELGYLTDPGVRLGYLDKQRMRAVRVVIDIGMHLELEVPGDSPLAPGERWTPQLAREFFGAHSGMTWAFLDSEIIRYLGWPGQATGYKLGERAWLAGRDLARRNGGADFDLKSWHMAALSMGSLGLDDLADELAAL